MLALTKRSEYAVIALCHLARTTDQVTSAREISALYSVPLPLLMNVLKLLQQNRLVKSVRGAQGGYQLVGEAERLNLEQVLEAVEGPMGLVQCSAPGETIGNGCELHGTCPIRLPMLRINDMFRRFVAGVTIADLALDGHFGGQEANSVLVKVTTP